MLISLQHEELEDLKRAWRKSEKKKEKAAKKEVAIDEEGSEVRPRGPLCKQAANIAPRPQN